MSCLAQLSRQKLIWHSQVPESTSNNTSEMSGLSWAPTAQLPVMGTCVFSLDSKHAPGVCCQQLLLSVQYRLRFTTQHVYCHEENLRRMECWSQLTSLNFVSVAQPEDLRHSESAACASPCGNA